MKYFFIAIYFCAAFSFYAQTDTSRTFEVIENILEDATIDDEDSQIYDMIEFLLNNPIRINNATTKELLQIPFLNQATALAIIKYRDKNHGIFSEEQLRDIEGINDELFQKILPFIKFDNEESPGLAKSIFGIFSGVNYSLRSRLINDLQNREGFYENKFLGTKPKSYNRLILNSKNKYHAGILFEKDAGEKSLTDFTSFHAAVYNISIFDDIIFGDYVFEFGQGLAIWSPYGLSKSSDAIGAVSRNARGSLPYISSDENRFLRGASFTLSTNNFSIKSFLSSRNIDASIDSSSNKVIALITDGYHRTQNELNKKDLLKEFLIGANINYFLGDAAKIGLLYLHSNYDRALAVSHLQGKDFSSLNYLSASYSAAANKLFVSGEFSFFRNILSTINNAEFFISKNISLVFSYRNFSNEYFTIHGNSFGEKGIAQNESGFYTGIYFNTKYGSINFYYDQYKYPFAADDYLFSASGKEFSIYYKYKIFKNTEIKLRGKYENNDQVLELQNENRLVKRYKNNLRAEISQIVSKNLRIKIRYEIVSLSSVPGSPKETGNLFFQDFSFQPSKLISICGRIIFFKTDSFYSRIYEFENDLTGLMTNPFLSGEGIKWYLLARLKTSLGLNISLKYSELYQPYEKTLGSGNSVINGNIDNRLSLQLDFIF
jgi:hypothetical protein